MMKIHLMTGIALAIGLGATVHAAPAGTAPATHGDDSAVEKFDVYREISPLSITPGGWIREYLVRQQKGLSSHPDAQGYPLNTNMWDGVIPSQSKSWWPYEQTGYYLDGMARLGYLLGDEKLLSRYQRNIDWVVSHPTDKGLIGTSLYCNPSHWPNAVFFKSVIPHVMATGDQKTIDAWHRHYTATSAKDIGLGERNVLNVEGLLRTYGWTNDKALLQKAEEAYVIHDKDPGSFQLPYSLLKSDHKVVIHGVTFAEALKLPVLFYMYTGKKEYLDAAEKGMRTVIRDHMSDSGVPSSTEYLSTRDPLQAHETCVSSDFAWTLGYYLMATGNAVYADMLEKDCFNAGPGAVNKDFTGLQYFSADNQVIATGSSNHAKNRRGGNWMQYRPDHEPACCPGNAHRLMPIYATRMWMRDRKGGIVAALYGPSEVTFEHGGIKVTIEERTSYPFDEKVAFVFKVDGAVKIPFSFRIPGWCGKPSVSVNGKPYKGDLKPGAYVTLDRTFKSGDKVEVRLPMPVRLNRYQNALSVERGPVLYSYAVPEKVEVDVKATKNKDFPALAITPTGDWNYALDVNENNFAKRVSVIPARDGAYPFDGGSGAPALKVPVRKVKGWTLDQGKMTPPIPIAYELEKEQEWLTLVPYGATRLRMTHFPECVERVEIPVGGWEISPAYDYDKSRLIDDQKFAPETGDAVEWKPASPNGSGIVDLSKALDEKKGLAYARTTIESDRSGKAWLAVNAKDSCIVWLNGKIVHRMEPPNDVEFQAPDMVPVTLNKGRNEVQVKVAKSFPVVPVGQYPAGWGVRLRCVRDK